MIGQECAYGGWVSSFAVLEGFSSKEHATAYSSIYWISITFFRFALAMVRGSPSQKVQIFALIGVVTSVGSYWVIYFVQPEVGLVLMSVFYGLGNSALYAPFLTIPE